MTTPRRPPLDQERIHNFWGYLGGGENIIEFGDGEVITKIEGDHDGDVICALRITTCFNNNVGHLNLHTKHYPGRIGYYGREHLKGGRFEYYVEEGSGQSIMGFFGRSGRSRLDRLGIFVVDSSS